VAVVLGSTLRSWNDPRSFGDLKLNADVRSPVTARRQGVMFGSIRVGCSCAKRFSMNWINEVWSNTSESTQPPLLQGEITSIGTRTPSPYGPAAKLALPVKISLVVSTVESP